MIYKQELTWVPNFFEDSPPGSKPQTRGDVKGKGYDQLRLKGSWEGCVFTCASCTDQWAG